MRDSNPFDLTHQKSMVVDNEIGFVESLNWEPKDLTQTRDYAIVTSHAHEVADGALFRRRLGARRSRPIPNRCSSGVQQYRQRVAEFIDKTKHTL